MRDIVLTLFIFAMLPLCYMRPMVGLLMWSWISYMLPHKLTWGFAYNFRFAYIIAFVTLIGVIRQRNFSIPVKAPVVFWFLFVVWCTVTTPFAANLDAAQMEWSRFIKIQAMVFVTLLVVRKREDLIYLIWVIVLSIGFWGLKGGIFTLFTGGLHRVFGPPGGFFSDNNAFALTLAMVVPLIRFTQLQAVKWWHKSLLLFFLLLVVLAIFGTYSRGGMVGASVMLVMLWLKTRKQLAMTMIMIILGVLVTQFLPEKWSEKMGTINAFYRYQTEKLQAQSQPAIIHEMEVQGDSGVEGTDFILNPKRFFDMLQNPDLEDPRLDSSMRGRLNAWSFVYHMIQDRPFLGGGFQAFKRGELYWTYAPLSSRYNDAHSVFFEVLGEQGFVGFFIFILMYYTTYTLSKKTILITRNEPTLRWASDLSKMLQVSFVGYFVAGLTLGMAFFDLPYHFMSILVLTHSLAAKELAELKANRKEPSKRVINSIYAVQGRRLL